MELRRDGGLEVSFLKRSVLQGALPSDYLDRALVPRSDRTPRHGGRVRAMLDEIDEGFAALDWEYRYTHVNPAACRLLEHSETEILGRTPCELWPEFSSPEVDGAYRAAMELGRPAIIEYETADHQWFEERIYPTTMGLSVYFRNIDERKHLEEALRKSEEQATLLIRHAPAAIFELDLRSRSFTSVNDYMCDSTGYSREELLTLDPSKLVAKEDRPRYEERIRKMLAGKAVSPSVEYRCTTKDGEERWVVMSSTPLFIEGEATGVFVVAHDVTERKQAEEALQESHRRAELLAWTASSLLSTDDPWGFVEELCHKVMAELDCQVFTNYLVDEDTGRLHLNACAGVPAIEAGRVEWLDRCATARACEAEKELLIACGVTASVCHPLMVQDAALGTLSFGTSTRGRFADDEIELMKAVADHVAMAVHHKRAEVARRTAMERERYLADVVEQADVPLAIREPEGHLVMFNQAFADLAGYSREELEKGSSTLALELTPTDWWEVESPLLARAVAERRPVRYEKEYVRKDGSRVPIEVFAQPVFDDAGALLHYRSFLTDISDRKQTEQTLRQSEERFRATFELAAAGIGHCAADGHWLAVNDRLCEMLGYEREELLGLTLADVTYPEDLPAHLALIDDLLDGKAKRYTLEKRYVRKDGGLLWGALSATLVRDASSEPDYFIVVIEDIGEHRLAEEAQREQAALRYSRRLIEASLDPLVTISAQGTITDVNAAAERVTGLGRDELIGSDFCDYFTEPSKPGPATCRSSPRERWSTIRWPSGTATAASGRCCTTPASIQTRPAR